VIVKQKIKQKSKIVKKIVHVEKNKKWNRQQNSPTVKANRVGEGITKDQ